MRDDIQERPDDRDRPRRRDRDDDYRDYDDRPPATFPTSVKIAGIVWIVFGGLLLVNMGITLVVTFVLSSSTGSSAASGAVMSAGLCTAVLIGLFGAAFLFVGVQSVNGTARDTLGNGIGSIILGALALGLGLIALIAGAWQGALNLVSGGGLIAAGVLALMGRSEYVWWKRAQRRHRDD